MGRARLHKLLWIAGTLTLTACTSILGVKDIFLDPNAGPGDDGGLGDRTTSSDGPGGNDGGGGDGSGDGSCSADLQTSQDHCGRCGHSCLGGQCTAGQCQPVILANGGGDPRGIAISASDVFWTSYTGDAVYKISKLGGGSATVFAQGDGGAAPNTNEPWGIAVHNGYVYWVNSEFFTGSLMRCPVTGCAGPAQIVLRDLDRPIDVTFTGGKLYINEGNKDTVVTADEGDGGGRRIFTTDAYDAFYFASDGTHVYWVADRPGGVSRAALTIAPDAAVEDLGTSGFDGRSIAIDNTSVYYTALADNNGGLGVVVKRPKAGGAPVQLAAQQGFPLDVAVDGERIYWLTYARAADGGADTTNGMVKACSLNGPCTPVTIAAGQAQPRQMALDTDAIYWVNMGDGRVMKLAKP